MNRIGITYANHPVIPTKSEPCLGLKIPRVERTINAFREILSILPSISEISDSEKKIRNESGMTNNNGSKSTPEVDSSESLGRNLLKKPSKNPKITNAVKLGSFLMIELDSI
jgi:hypothetical protein